MKRMASICDTCSMKVSTLDCELCGADVCSNCVKVIQMENSFFALTYAYGLSKDVPNVRLCEKCKNKISYFEKKDRPLVDKEVGKELLLKLIKSIIKQNEIYRAQKDL